MQLYEYQKHFLRWFHRQNKDTALFAHETNFWLHLEEEYKDNLALVECLMQESFYKEDRL